MKKGRYKYQSFKEAFGDIGDSVVGHFEPIFESYRLDPITFCLQGTNLVLVFVALNQVFGPLVDWLTHLMVDNSIFGVRTITLIGVAAWVSTLKGNKTIRWQLLFEVNKKMTKKILAGLLLVNAGAYGIKEAYAARTKE